MRECVVKVFKFDELDIKAKEKAMDWFRSCIDSNDYSCVTEDFEAILKLLGFTDVKCWWSGFSSQGDGACFEGHWRAADVQPDKVWEYMPDNAENSYALGSRRIIQIAKRHPESHAKITAGGHYQHSNTMRSEVDCECGNFDEDAEFLSACRSLADAYYGHLESQDEYLHSEENVSDSILANEYEFTSDGTRWTRG